MKSYRGIITVLLVIAMTMCAVPVFAAVQYEKASQDDYIAVVDELVQVTADCEKAEAEAVDNRNDALAIGVATGLFVASGGVGVAVKLLFPVIKLIPFL